MLEVGAAVTDGVGEEELTVVTDVPRLSSEQAASKRSAAAQHAVKRWGAAPDRGVETGDMGATLDGVVTDDPVVGDAGAPAVAVPQAELMAAVRVGGPLALHLRLVRLLIRSWRADRTWRLCDAAIKNARLAAVADEDRFDQT